MERGAIERNDPRLLTRAILGLYNSIWHWYRPNGIVPLRRVADFFTDRAFALLGVGPEAAGRARAAA
jgi:TetR/AcrR family transcriptional regulator, cholesterol catabolism regulator